jgi:hypothetical protein
MDIALAALAPITLIGFLSEKINDSDEKPLGKEDAVHACEGLIWKGYTNRIKIQSIDLPAVKPVPENAVPCNLPSEIKKTAAVTPQASASTYKPIPQAH